MVPGVSLRTLVLMVGLLAAVVAWQHFTRAKPGPARILWLAADCHTASTIRVPAAAPVATAPASGTARGGEPEP